MVSDKEGVRALPLLQVSDPGHDLMIHMTTKTLTRGAMICALFGVLTACNDDDLPTTEQEGSGWGLNDWKFADPGPEDQDVVTPVEDMAPDIGGQLDLGERDTGREFDLGEPDLGEIDMGGELDLGPTGATTGSPCNVDNACQGGTCLITGFAGAEWDEGYCTFQDCAQEGCNEMGGGECVLDAVQPGLPFCAQPCNPNPQPGFDSCRDGYECRSPAEDPMSPADGFFCLPPLEVEPLKAIDGEACLSDADCAGGSCIPENEGWPAGYCTTIGCRDRDDCSNDGSVDNRCYQNQQGPNFCVRICQEQSDCRVDYVCQPVGGGLGFCVPDPSEPIAIDPATYPVALTCGPSSDPANQSHTFSYTIAPTTTAYMVTALARDGRQIATQRTDLPSGGNISYFRGQNSYQNTTAQLFRFVSPIPTPAQPEFANQLEAGMHQHTIYSESSDVCHYVLEESSPGTTIDLNIYLVGVPNITASSAPTDMNLQATMTAFSNIYASTGISLGTVRYFDITGADAQAYQVIRTEDDIGELVSKSQLPGQTQDDALSLNVFFVRSISLGGGTIGISQGLPGPAGIHGTRASGVVFTSEFLGQTFNEPGQGVVNGNQYTGVVMAHELGHYLGLFHTTEQFGQGADPLADTPQCSPNQFPNNCPDLNNLMFPLAGISHTTVTANQSYVIGVNPLTKD